MMKITQNSLTVLQERYLWTKKNGELEKPEELFTRVASHLAGKNAKLKKRFLDSMLNLEFLPNSPTLMNAGKKHGQLAACFVLPLEDDLNQIMDTLKLTALVHQSGGGTGFDFSPLRPEGSTVHSSRGVATGPIGFLKLFNQLTEHIKQGGLRRGANMGILSMSHPDIENFIVCKKDTSQIVNFNISVSATDSFFKILSNGEDWSLKDPHTGKVIKKISAKKLFNDLCTAAWETGEPGLIFVDEINRHNPTSWRGPMTATNPCGEQPLLGYEACNLGSINLNKILSGGEINWDKLAEISETGTLFLNRVIDTCYYPDPKIHNLCNANRKIGLGVMGFADLLIKLNIAYGSPESFDLGETIMRFIRDEAIKTSQALAKKQGPFESFSKSLWKKRGVKPLRNATLTTVAPTGTISMIAGASSGIEPVFNFVYERHVLDGKILREVHEDFALRIPSIPDQLRVAREGTLKNLNLSSDLKKVFVSARDISPADHVTMQARFQKYSDSAVSKTINLSRENTVDDVKQAYLLAHKLKCKGITVYREGTRPKQVMQLTDECLDCNI